MSDTAMQLRNIARVLRKGFAGHLAFDSAECQGMAKSLATAADELDRAERILAALREPNEALFIDGYNAGYDDRKCETDYDPYGRLPDVAEIIRAAVAAAEQEVGL